MHPGLDHAPSGCLVRLHDRSWEKGKERERERESIYTHTCCGKRAGQQRHVLEPCLLSTAGGPPPICLGLALPPLPRPSPVQAISVQCAPCSPAYRLVFFPTGWTALFARQPAASRGIGPLCPWKRRTMGRRGREQSCQYPSRRRARDIRISTTLPARSDGGILAPPRTRAGRHTPWRGPTLLLPACRYRRCQLLGRDARHCRPLALSLSLSLSSVNAASSTSIRLHCVTERMLAGFPPLLCPGLPLSQTPKRPETDNVN